jgi:hypothetical protein
MSSRHAGQASPTADPAAGTEAVSTPSHQLFWLGVGLVTAVVLVLCARISWAFTAEYSEAGILGSLVAGAAVVGLGLGAATVGAQRLFGIARPHAMVVLTAAMLLALGSTALGAVGGLAEHQRGTAAEATACHQEVVGAALDLARGAGTVTPIGDAQVRGDRDGTCVVMVVVPGAASAAASTVDAAAVALGWSGEGTGTWRSPNGVVVTYASEPDPKVIGTLITLRAHRASSD